MPRKNILSESPTRITAKMPKDLPLTYQATVHVINQQSLESRESAIVIAYSCRAPLLAPVAKQSSKRAAAINNSGATVHALRLALRVRQQSDRRTNRSGLPPRQYTATAGVKDQALQSHQFALPATLFPGRALLYVIDAEGRETSPGMEIKYDEQKVSGVRCQVSVKE